MTLRAARVVALTLCLAIALGVCPGSVVWAQGNSTPIDFTIAFIGDQGVGPNAWAVLHLIKDEGADAVVHAGDFDYVDLPVLWDFQINQILGRDFPYFGAVGNHDADEFYGFGGYQHFLEARMNRLGIPWEDDLGVQSSFKYRGIFFVLTAPGVLGPGDSFHDLYIHNELAVDDSIWRISSWHKNMRQMQVGGKSDATGWGVYEESRRGGAIIATGHEHSYSRTHLLSSCEEQEVASTEHTLVLNRDDPETPEDEGRSFVFASGLGGASIRDQELAGDWWASIYTSDQNANYGALFGVFNYRGDPRLAYFYFKDIDGNIADEFFVQSTLAENSPPPDADGDGVADTQDNCPFVPNFHQADADHNGIGTACQCGDVNRDGFTNIVDAWIIAYRRTSQQARPYCDVNGDGACNFFDAYLIYRGRVSSAPEGQLCRAWSG